MGGWVARSSACAFDCLHMNAALPRTIFIRGLHMVLPILLYISAISGYEYSRESSGDYLGSLEIEEQYVQYPK